MIAAMSDSRDDYLGLVVAGWTMAFVLPIGGIVAGLALANRRPGHAFGMMLVGSLSLLILVALVVLDIA
jgi:hypothetical protein